MKGLCKAWWKEIALALLTLAATGFAVALVFSSLRLNLREMESRLLMLEIAEADRHNASLVGRFVRQYRVYRQLQTQAESDQAEQKSYLLEEATSPALSQGDLRGLDRVNTHLLSWLRRLLGSDSLSLSTDFLALQELERGWDLEQRQRYQEALAFYATLVPKPGTVGLIRLHEGFSLAVLGEFDKAQEKLGWVAGHYRGEALGHTAASLLSYLDYFAKEQERLAKSRLGRAEKEARLAMLFQCQNSPEQWEDLARRYPQLAHRLYYRQGRCLEGQGLKAEAVNSYMRVLRASTDPVLLADANRRLYMAGSEDSLGAARRLALDLNAVVQDTALSRMEDVKASLGIEKEAVLEEPSLEPNSLAGEAPMLKNKLRRHFPSRERDIPPAPSPRPKPRPVLKEAPSAEPEPSIEVREPDPLPPVYAPGTRVQVLMRNGSRHSGILQSPSDASLVQLKTERWVMGLVQNEIRSIQLAP